MSNRPARQPGAVTPTTKPVTKQPMDHPATITHTTQAVSAPELTANKPEDPLEPFSTRIRRSQRREIDRLRYLTDKSTQTIISEALALYLQEHPQ